MGYGLGSIFPSPYLIGHSIFFCLLGVTLFTDTWVMLISRRVTINTIPLACILSIMKLLPLSFSDSLFGAFFGYILLLMIAKSAKNYIGQEALGQGDIDLLCMIGAFSGWQGCWFALLIGSVLGSLVGLIIALKERTSSLRELQLPLGTFLAMGAILYSIHAHSIYKLLLVS